MEAILLTPAQMPPWLTSPADQMRVVTYGASCNPEAVAVFFERAAVRGGLGDQRALDILHAIGTMGRPTPRLVTALCTLLGSYQGSTMDLAADATMQHLLLTTTGHIGRLSWHLHDPKLGHDALGAPDFEERARVLGECAGVLDGLWDRALALEAAVEDMRRALTHQVHQEWNRTHPVRREALVFQSAHECELPHEPSVLVGASGEMIARKLLQVRCPKWRICR